MAWMPHDLFYFVTGILRVSCVLCVCVEHMYAANDASIGVRDLFTCSRGDTLLLERSYSTEKNG